MHEHGEGGKSREGRAMTTKEETMRKHMREILRHKAERLGAKASRYVAAKWNEHQCKKLGRAVRARNVARGTRPKRLWRGRGAA